MKILPPARTRENEDAQEHSGESSITKGVIRRARKSRHAWTQKLALAMFFLALVSSVLTYVLAGNMSKQDLANTVLVSIILSIVGSLGSLADYKSFLALGVFIGVFVGAVVAYVAH